MSALILVANLGSTSFKFRLFEMPSERLVAKGKIERIGSSKGSWTIGFTGGETLGGEAAFSDHAAAVNLVEVTLRDQGAFDLSRAAAFGFKVVAARGVSGTQVLDEQVLRAMEAVNTLFPAHNPPYVAAVRTFQKLYPHVPCIGTFETAFYDTMPPENYRYPVPLVWEKEYGIRRYGFHGASHRFVTGRAAELMQQPGARLISCHLGGSSSIACVRDGVGINSSWGMTPQSGLPQNNRVGDFDVFSFIYLARDLGLGIDAVEEALSKNAGLKGMSGLDSGDLRDLKAAMTAGNEEARIALEVFIRAIRKSIGQFLVELNGADGLIFTGGIGENNPDVRQAVCRDLDFCGLKLDEAKNNQTKGTEAELTASGSKVRIFTIPTNEEIVIARNAWAKLKELRPT